MRLALDARTTGDCRYELQPEQLPPGWRFDAARGEWWREVQTLAELTTALEPLAENQQVVVEVVSDRHNRSTPELRFRVVY